MRVAVLTVNLLLFIVSFYISLQNGFHRAALSTWFFIFITIVLAFNIRRLLLNYHREGGAFSLPRGKRRYDGPEKRSHYRVVYSPSRRPWLVINDCAFEVADISQRGLRFLNHKDIAFGGNIEGKVTFTDGYILDIAGNIEWKKAEQTSLILSTIIPHSFIKKELEQLA